MNTQSRVLYSKAAPINTGSSNQPPINSQNNSRLDANNPIYNHSIYQHHHSPPLTQKFSIIQQHHQIQQLNHPQPHTNQNHYNYQSPRLLYENESDYNQQQNINNNQSMLQDEGIEHKQLDLKSFRLKATDFFMSPVLQNLLAKLWNLMISYNYTRDQIRERTEWLLQIPLRIDIYERFISLFRKGLGELYQTEFYVCQEKNYAQEYVFFQRFCFDFVSLSGTLLYKLSINQYEYIFRKVFSVLTFYDKHIEELSFKRLENIVSPVTKEFLDEIVTNKKAKAIIVNSIQNNHNNHQGSSSRHSPMNRTQNSGITNRQSLEKKNKLKKSSQNQTQLTSRSNTLTSKNNQRSQISGRKNNNESMIIDETYDVNTPLRIPKDDGQQHNDRKNDVEDESPTEKDMVNLINLNQIAKKVKDDQAKRQKDVSERNRVKIFPFIINCEKEDLDLVMQRPDILKQINRDLQLGKYMINTHNSTSTQKQVSTPHQQIPHVSQQNISNNQRPGGQDYQLRVKQMLMYKQLTQMNKDEEEFSGDDKTPNMDDQSPLNRNDRSPQSNSSPFKQREATLQFPKYGSDLQQQANLSSPQHSQQAANMGETDEDSKYIKYVWNKKTKRLEKRDLRNSNLENIDKKKFEKFQKVNQKSKVLCQPNENYLNTSFFGDFSPEEAKRELLYGIQEEDYADEGIMSKTQNSLGFGFGNNKGKYDEARKKSSINQKLSSNQNYSALGNLSMRLNEKRARSQVSQESSLTKSQIDQTQVDQKLKMIKMILRGEDYDDQVYLHQTSQLFQNHDQSTTYDDMNRLTFRINPGNNEVIDSRQLFMRKKLHKIQQQNKWSIQMQREISQNGNQSLQMHRAQLPKLELTGAQHHYKNLMSLNQNDYSLINSNTPNANQKNVSLRLRINNMKPTSMTLNHANETFYNSTVVGQPTFDARSNMNFSAGGQGQGGVFNQTLTLSLDDKAANHQDLHINTIVMTPQLIQSRGAQTIDQLSEDGEITTKKNKDAEINTTPTLEQGTRINSFKRGLQDTTFQMTPNQNNFQSITNAQNFFKPLKQPINKRMANRQPYPINHVNHSVKDYAHFQNVALAGYQTQYTNNNIQNFGLNLLKNDQNIQDNQTDSQNYQQNNQNKITRDDQALNDYLVNQSIGGVYEGRDYETINHEEKSSYRKNGVGRQSPQSSSINQSIMRSQLNKTSVLNPIKTKAPIHQVPMQDFQLETWRNAYRTTKSATRHFYTGTSFIIIDKI
eukprot:403359372